MKNYWHSFYHIPFDVFINYEMYGRQGKTTFVLFEGWKHIGDIRRELLDQIDPIQDEINFSINGNHIFAYNPYDLTGLLTIVATDTFGKSYELDFII